MFGSFASVNRTASVKTSVEVGVKCLSYRGEYTPCTKGVVLKPKVKTVQPRVSTRSGSPSPSSSVSAPLVGSRPRIRSSPSEKVSLSVKGLVGFVETQKDLPPVIG